MRDERYPCCVRAGRVDARSMIGAFLDVAERLWRGLRRRWRRLWYAARLGRMGPGCVLGERLRLYNPRNIHLGAGVVVNDDVLLQSCEGADLTIGNNVIVSYRVMILTGGRARDHNGLVLAEHEAAAVEIGSGSWIGAGATILPGVTIGKSCVIAAGAVLTASAIAERGQRALADNELEAALEWHGQASLLDANGAEVLALGTAVVEAQNLASSQQEHAIAVQNLLESAARDIASNRLTSPPGENALERYRKVENLDPGNAGAREGLRKIHDRYIVLATQALTRAEFPQARQLASKALSIERDSEAARALQGEIAAAAERQDRELAQRLAREAEARVAQAEAARAAAEAARVGAEQERKRRQDAEAHRLLAVAEAKARAEREARDSAAQTIEDAERARPRVVVDFQGFHPKYGRDGLTRDLLFKNVAPMIRGAGYEIVTRGQVHDANYTWTNVKLMAYRLSVSENTANGLYSYAGSLNILEDANLRISLSAALDKPPLWTRGHSGLGPPTHLRILLDRMVDITRAFIENRPGRRR